MNNSKNTKVTKYISECGLRISHFPNFVFFVPSW